MNYKNKYNKYKNKYIDLMDKIHGGALNLDMMNYFKTQIIKSSNNKKGYNDYIIKSFKKTDDNGNSIPTQNPVNMMYCESWLHFIAAVIVWSLNKVGIEYFNESLDNIVLIMDNSKLVEVYNSNFTEKSQSEQLIIDQGDRPVSDHYLIKGYFIIKDNTHETEIKLGSINLEGLCNKDILESKERQNELFNLLGRTSLNIICFQEMCLKEDQKKGWIDRTNNIKLIQESLPTFNLINDNYTSMIGYNKYIWELIEILEIRRMGIKEENKKSNAYKLKSKEINGMEIIIVNIHLKAGMTQESVRINELKHIYDKVKEFSLKFTIPVFLVGDFNQDFKNIENIIKGFK
tara:strand:+ start:956 stop:1993 length:1038 start_codon:yes stop_codon:yes gene_type:complete